MTSLHTISLHTTSLLMIRLLTIKINQYMESLLTTKQITKIIRISIPLQLGLKASQESRNQQLQLQTQNLTKLYKVVRRLKCRRARNKIKPRQHKKQSKAQTKNSRLLNNHQHTYRVAKKLKVKSQSNSINQMNKRQSQHQHKSQSRLPDKVHDSIRC